MRIIENRDRSQYRQVEPKTLASEFVRHRYSSDLDRYRYVDGKEYTLVYSSDCHCPTLQSIEKDPEKYGCIDKRVMGDGTVVYQVLKSEVDSIDEPMYKIVFCNDYRRPYGGRSSKIGFRQDDKTVNIEGSSLLK